MTVEERDYIHKAIDDKWISIENIPDNMNIGELRLLYFVATSPNLKIRGFTPLIIKPLLYEVKI